MMDFLYIGQRVIVGGTEIATVIRPPREHREGVVWVRLSDGVVQWHDINNVKPLPNGEL